MQRVKKIWFDVKFNKVSFGGQNICDYLLIGIICKQDITYKEMLEKVWLKIRVEKLWDWESWFF